MLILTRRMGEKAFIGDDITIVVLDVGTNQIRLGFEAPKEVNIVREELVNPNIKKLKKNKDIKKINNNTNEE